MFKLKPHSHLLKARALQSGLVKPFIQHHSSNNKQNTNNSRWQFPFLGILTISTFAITQSKNGVVDAHSDQDDKNKDKTFFQKNVLDYKQIARDNFKIPHMLLERERQKQEEYNQRKDVDIEELGMSD